MPASNEPCHECARTDETVKMLNPSSVFCKFLQHGVWRNDKTDRACFVPKD